MAPLIPLTSHGPLMYQEGNPHLSTRIQYQRYTWGYTLYCVKYITDYVNIMMFHQANASVNRILHITDIHWDPQYTEGLSTQCNEPLCCRPPNQKGTKFMHTVYWIGSMYTVQMQLFYGMSGSHNIVSDL